MIKVRCRTNIDEVKGKRWPEEFCCRPQVGDKVQADDGYQLYIVAITHAKYQTNNYDVHRGDEKYKPMLIIELHKREAVPGR